jgi:hypothetical protein
MVVNAFKVVFPLTFAGQAQIKLRVPCWHVLIGPFLSELCPNFHVCPNLDASEHRRSDGLSFPPTTVATGETCSASAACT